ncbi:MAG: hypothetical protein BEN18_08270 [Epulopiscium sp. Nuni2H_MBin001]|nr:MAG: hypothetical protein BEN18_08270 [Epulopiscium sp. Nuni2H_MBin001]
MRLIPVSELKLDTKIAMDIRDEHHNLLITKDTLVNPQSLQRLKNSNVIAVYIKDQYCYNNLDIPYTSDSTVMLEKVNTLQVAITNTIKGGVAAHDAMVDALTEVRAIVNELDDHRYALRIAYEPSKISSLNVISEKTVYIAMMSSLLALKLGYSRQETYSIFLGALLKDVASIVPVLGDTVNLNSKQHPIIGCTYIKDNFEFPPEVARIILEHHELYDGKGYPYNLRGDEIYGGTRIISIIEAFYKINSTTMAKGSKALQEDFKNWTPHLDPRFLKKFLNHTNVFPPDTLVRLTNGDVGVIMGTRTTSPFRPQIRILKSVTYPLGTMINLASLPQLHIYRLMDYFD